MTRPDLRMEPSEIAAFLDRCRSMCVGVLNDQGELDVAVAAVEHLNALVVLSFASDDPILELLADGRPLCAQADESPSYYEIQGVVLSGRARDHLDGRFELLVDKAIGFDFAKIPARTS